MLFEETIEIGIVFEVEMTCNLFYRMLSPKEQTLRFNNSFFKALAGGHHLAAMMIPSDRAMIDDPECMEWIRQYAADEKLFFDDFSDAYKKMSMLGAKFES